MGEKGNSVEAVADAQRVVTAHHNVVLDTVTTGVDTVTGIVTGAVTGAATGVVKDKVDEKIKKDDEPTH